MFKANFDIMPSAVESTDMQGSLLLMEVGEKLFSYLVYDKPGQRFIGYRQYMLDYFPGKTNFESLQDILSNDSVLQLSYPEAYVIYNYSDSGLLPEHDFHSELNKPVVELTHGNASKGLFLSEKVNGWDIYNIYRIPREVHTLMQQKFAAGKYWHYYSLVLSGINKEEAPEENMIKIIIAADNFIVAVYKQHILQLIQTYTYQTPDDVSYYLLSLCQQFGCNPETVALKLSGLIDEQSRLYQEILKYFLNVEWDILPESVSLQEDFSQYPPHYFSPLLKMALCV